MHRIELIRPLSWIHRPSSPAAGAAASARPLEASDRVQLGVPPVTAASSSLTSPSQAVASLQGAAAAPAAGVADRVAQAISAPVQVRDLSALDALPPGPPDDAPLRVWEKASGRLAGPVALKSEAAPPPPAPSLHPVTRHGLDHRLHDLDKQRSAWLHNLSHLPANGRVVPKDGSLKPDVFYMSYTSDDDTSARFIAQMARIGRAEGFRVAAETEAGHLRDLKRQLSAEELANVTVVPLVGSRDVWSEDNGELTLDHHVSVPAFVGDATLVDDAIYRDRVRRFHPEARLDPDRSGYDLEQYVTDHFPDADFSIHGAVDERRNQESMVALGLAEQAPVRENATYVEGGNVLTGTRPGGGGYALVGRDSVAVSRALLERDTGHPVTEKQTLHAMARDLGIRPEDLHAVEQPGEFHLDMRMALVGPGQVLVNDARAAARLQERWLREDHRAPAPPGPGASWLKKALFTVRSHWWERTRGRQLEGTIRRLREEAERRAGYEDRTVADLQGTGLEVLRMPAVFVDPAAPGTDVANFVNCRQGADGRGHRFYVALGGEPRAEAVAARHLLDALPTGIDRVYFLDRALTRPTLDLSGGIKCRSKPAGQVVVSG